MIPSSSNQLDTSSEETSGDSVFLEGIDYWFLVPLFYLSKNMPILALCALKIVENRASSLLWNHISRSRLCSFRAVALMQLGLYYSAINFVQESLSIRQADPTAAKVLSDVFVRAGDYRSAMVVTVQSVWERQKELLLARNELFLVEGHPSEPFTLNSNFYLERPHGNMLCDFSNFRGAQFHRYPVISGEENVWPSSSFVLNLIADADIHESCLIQMCEARLPNANVINSPDAVLASRRDYVYNKLRNIGGLTVPKCIRLESTDRNLRFLMVKSSLAEGKVRFPVMIRPAGAHSFNSHIIFNIEQMTPSMTESKTNAVYLTQFHDCRFPDGYWRKTRAICVGDTVMIEHHYIADRPIVHSAFARAFARHRDWVDIEAIDVMESVGPDIEVWIREIRKRIPLDIFAVDFAKLPSGGFIIFEVSACIRFIRQSEVKNEGSHVRATVRKIENRIADYITMRVAASYKECANEKL